MSKELANLLDLKSAFISYCKTLGCEDNYIKVCSNKFDIIEAALKDHEKPKKIVGSISFEQSMENYVKNNCPSIAKKLKALEIVKDRFDIQFTESDLPDYHGIMQIGINPIYIKTQEEFDLLKETLSCSTKN